MTRIFMTVALVLLVGAAQSESITVSDEAALAEAITTAEPGDRIQIAPGEYDGGMHFRDITGEPDHPIVIAGADPDEPPVFGGGGNGMQLSNIAHVTLQDIHFIGPSGNGLNIDDGGTFDTPSHHVTLRRLTIREVGPEGNRDGIKLSGVQDFRVEDCVIEDWGDAGQGVDMVGCHRGVITGCQIRHNPAAPTAGIQAKGGSRDIVIRDSYIEGSARGVNIGGSTGLQFFRPEPPGYEAKAITVEGNVFTRNQTPVAYVGVDGAAVRYNTIHRPGRWALRILQETTDDGFVPSRNGEFTDNIIVFHSEDWASGGVNIGPHTAPATFTFARNAWYCMDNPEASAPNLPTPETDALIGVAPLLTDPANGDFSLQPESPAQDKGHTPLED
ncbi:MAG: right-handed parallel beta-helix repeat-containing protein [Candidatus Hydrogenedentota bacterium]